MATMFFRSFVLLSLLTCTAEQKLPSSSALNQIVLVGIERYDRELIRKTLERVILLNPKVIAIDIEFPEYSGDREDIALVSVMEKVKRLVLPTELHFGGEDYNGKKMISVVSTSVLPLFSSGLRQGFVSAEGNPSDVGGVVPKSFFCTQVGYTGDVYYHFSIMTAMLYDSVKTSSFLTSNPNEVQINYGKNKIEFNKLTSSLILDGKMQESQIKNKIVLIGFLGPGNQDKFVSPHSNRSRPDMYGVEYLATILRQVLDDSPTK